MNRKIAFSMALIIVFLSFTFIAVKVQRVKASDTIYIRADGSIEPLSASITSVDNVTYTFTDNISDGIVVERSDIIIDGVEYTLQGSGDGDGLNLTSVHNITIRNINIKNFEYGIRLVASSKISIQGNHITANNEDGIHLESSTYNTVSGNHITNNDEGVKLYSTSNNNTVSGNHITNSILGLRLSYSNYNTISGNNITANTLVGVGLSSSANNTVSGNHITNNWPGVSLQNSNYNTVSGNNITNNEYGIWIEESDYNEFYNNYIDNINQTYVEQGYANIWDKGYPAGGNYWSDYEDKYPNATEIDESGIWDTPYVIDELNQDNYPIVPEFPSFVILPMFMTATLLAALVYRRKRS